MGIHRCSRAGLELNRIGRCITVIHLDPQRIHTGPRSPQGIRGLYHVGASNRPGNGVPLVMVGARLLADVVEQDLASAGEDALNAD